MIYKIRMPRVDANVQEATVGAWLVEPPRKVQAGQPLVEVITDKANFEYEAEQEGILRQQVASAKSVVPVGYIIALMSDTTDEPLPDVSDENDALMEEYQQALITGEFGDLDVEAPILEEPESPEPAPERRRVRATPAARKAASEHGVDLRTVAEAVDGVVKREHVEDYLAREDRG